ncbi:MAG: AEC family transporter [Methylococcales bacterium]|nr:AEC family transporter [Methylococcales bacterium]
MNATLLQMSLLMACGIGWKIAKPANLGAEQTRLILTSVVYYLLLPAMVLEVLWSSDLGSHSFNFMLVGASSILLAMLCTWVIGVLFKLENKRLGAIILATVPNVTYLGLPVLEQTFGYWARSVAIQVDLFSAAPIVFTLGIMIARHYGEETSEQPKSTLSFLNAPPFWAAAIAITLNLNGIISPLWFTGVLQKLSGAVVPLMLFSLGLALSWQAVTRKNLPYVLPIVIIKMCLLPLFAMTLISYLPMEGHYKAAAVLDLAMPSMVVGVVFCDRYKLDSALYAMTVTVTTAMSLFSLPFWHHLLVNEFMK